MIEPEVAILKTFPAVFFREVSKRQFIEEFVHGLNDGSIEYWQCPMSGVPQKPVLYCYIVIGNRIRYRANIVEFQPGGERTFDDGRSMSGKAWMILTGPIVKAPERIERRGFQGFRYTPILF